MIIGTKLKRLMQILVNFQLAGNQSDPNYLKIIYSRFAARKVQTKKLVFGDFLNRGHLKVLNDTKLILND